MHIKTCSMCMYMLTFETTSPPFVYPSGPPLPKHDRWSAMRHKNRNTEEKGMKNPNYIR